MERDIADILKRRVPATIQKPLVLVGSLSSLQFLYISL